MNLNGVKLIFADLDDTLTVLYKPATDNVKKYLNYLLKNGKSIVIITGQGKKNIYDRVICKINEDLRKHILICGCGGAYIYGFDEKGNMNMKPYYSIYDEKLNDEQKIKWREIINELIKEFNLKIYKKMPLEEFRKITNCAPTSIIMDDRTSQITFEVVNDLELRKRILTRAQELIKQTNIPVDVIKAGTYAIDFIVEGSSKTCAVKYIMENEEILNYLGIYNLKDNEIQVWGDKYSLVNGGTDMNMLYGLNKNVLAIDFRDEPVEELDLEYNIKLWNGKKKLSEGLEEYLELNCN